MRANIISPSWVSPKWVKSNEHKMIQERMVQIQNPMVQMQELMEQNSGAYGMQESKKQWPGKCLDQKHWHHLNLWAKSSQNLFLPYIYNFFYIILPFNLILVAIIQVSCFHWTNINNKLQFKLEQGWTWIYFSQVRMNKWYLVVFLTQTGAYTVQ